MIYLEKEIQKNMNNKKSKRDGFDEKFSVNEIEYDETIPEDEDLPRYVDYDD